ncbi:MAG TPA: superoxide dismutase family protein [bacterium]|nr:superoxide dismutase family protein [bacterium]
MNKLLYSVIIFSAMVISPSAMAEIAKASIKNTDPALAADPAKLIKGSATFQETPDGLKITIKFKSAPVGKHGIHIHQFGSCSDFGNAAGDHYNPMNAKHGLVQNDGIAKAHAGDFGNIEIGPDGTGVLKMVIPEMGISTGKYNVGGRSVVLHEKADDFSQPLGNAGGRIACGRIVIKPDPAPKP